MRLTLRGLLSLSGHAELEERLAGLEAAFFWLSLRRDQLSTAPTAADLEAMASDGVLSEVSRRLRGGAEDLALSPKERKMAEAALVELYGALMRAAQRGTA